MEVIQNPHLFISDQSYYIACKVGLFYDWKLLIIREEPGKEWEIPWGKRTKQDFWADITTTLIREVKEELAFDINPYIGNIRFIWISEYETIFDNEHSIFFLLYTCTLDALPDLELSPEHTAHKWIHKDEINDILHWRTGFKKIVRRCFENI